MEGKLYKSPNGEHYYLTVDGKIFAEIGGHPLKTINQSLSLKNCQAIENGYDLDELAREACNITDPLRLDSQKYKQDPYFRIGFNKGFQKAMEILGDKKFSKEDMFEAVMFGCSFEDPGIEGIETYNELKDLVIKRNTQTEWDVEILMEYKDIDELSVDKGSFLKPNDIYKPKLDSDGCLILRRI